MKVLVTGANGYLGRGIVKQLLDDGNIVVATDLDTSFVDKRSISINANIFELEDPYTFFGKPDVLLHLAWKNGFIHNSPDHINELHKHYKFIKLFIDSNIHKISVLGTMHEVGFHEGSINSSTVCNPMSLYGISKNTLRQLLTVDCTSSDTILQWIRGFYIVSNEPTGSSIFSKIANAYYHGNTVFPFTTGKNLYDFLDYNEFCLQVSAIVQQDEINGIINACSGEPMRLSEKVESFIKENNYNISLSYGVYEERKYDSKAIWGDDEKISRIMENYLRRHNE